MQLNQQTDYALRALMMLAEQEILKSSRLLTIREIAEFHQISRNHLMKVINTLVERGFVHAQRGRNGGIKLNKPSENINIGDVIRAIENNWNLVECFSTEKRGCRVQNMCRLQPVFQQALHAFWKELDQFTLADMASSISESLNEAPIFFASGGDVTPL
ncbi:MAG: RrF2 family transcriptional regulator [Halothiobacillus sp.]